MKSFAVLLAVVLTIHSVLEAEEPVPFEIAHRGASGYLPEHTREAVVMAHGLGAAYIEQDVVLSADDVPVVLHDIHLDDVSDVATRFPGRARLDGKHYALDFTLAELKQLEMRERFKLATGERVFPKRYSGSGTVFRIVTLEESLAIIAGLNASTRTPTWSPRSSTRPISAANRPVTSQTRRSNEVSESDFMGTSKAAAAHRWG